MMYNIVRDANYKYFLLFIDVFAPEDLFSTLKIDVGRVRCGELSSNFNFTAKIYRQFA